MSDWGSDNQKQQQPTQKKNFQEDEKKGEAQQSQNKNNLGNVSSWSRNDQTQIAQETKKQEEQDEAEKKKEIGKKTEKKQDKQLSSDSDSGGWDQQQKQQKKNQQVTEGRGGGRGRDGGRGRGNDDTQRTNRAQGRGGNRGEGRGEWENRGNRDDRGGRGGGRGRGGGWVDRGEGRGEWENRGDRGGRGGGRGRGGGWGDRDNNRGGDRDNNRGDRDNNRGDRGGYRGGDRTRNNNRYQDQPYNGNRDNRRQQRDRNGGRQGNRRGDNDFEKKDNPRQQDQSNIIQKQLTQIVQKEQFQPSGRICWPEASLYILKNKLTISFRKISEYRSDLLMIPFIDESMSVYPGQIINLCNVNYKEKLRQKSQKLSKIGSIYIGRSMGYDKFKGFAFCRVAQQGSKIKKQAIVQCLKEVFSHASRVAVNSRNVQSILLPFAYFDNLASGITSDEFTQLFLKTVIQIIENFKPQNSIKNITITTIKKEDFKSLYLCFQQKIMQYIQANQVCIDNV